MLGLSWSEIFLIVLVALLVIGPDKLPEVARTLAKTVRGIQRLASEVRYSINLDEVSTVRPTPQAAPVQKSEPAPASQSASAPAPASEPAFASEPASESASAPAKTEAAASANAPPTVAQAPKAPASTLATSPISHPSQEG